MYFDFITQGKDFTLADHPVGAAAYRAATVGNPRFLLSVPQTITTTPPTTTPPAARARGGYHFLGNRWAMPSRISFGNSISSGQPRV